MFDYLAGTLAKKAPTEVVVDCGGVGYLVHVSLHTSAALPAAGPVKLLVHVHQSENGQKLFGFWAELERSLFRLFQGVRGVGPTLAMNLLSHGAPEELVARLRAGDVKELTRIRGIGRKTAERLLVELKDRLPEVGAHPGPRRRREDVLAQALVSLGLTPAEAGERALRVLKEAPDEERLEVLLRACLREGGRSAAG